MSSTHEMKRTQIQTCAQRTLLRGDYGTHVQPPHPGEVLKDGVFDGSRISVVEAARQLGISRVQLSRLLNGQAGVSADMAIRLAMWLGGSPESWLRMQADYDLWQSERHGRPAVKRLRRAA